MKTAHLYFHRRLPGTSASHNFVFAAFILLAAGLIWPFGGGKKITMTISNLVPSAKGKVEIDHDQNHNTKIDLEVHYLAHPSALTPPQSVYVVWIQADGRAPENQGRLTVDNDLNGEFKTVTPYQNFLLFVTAEHFPQVRTPDGERVMWAQVKR